MLRVMVRKVAKVRLFMLDDFFTRALVAGLGIAVMAGPFGCFIVWRRLAYFGDTLAHSALLGVALALAFQINITASVFAVAAAIALSLARLGRSNRVGGDAFLGMLSHTGLALGLIALAFMPNVRVDLMSLLVGDILSVTKTDISIIYGGGLLLLGALGVLWRALFASTVDRDLAGGEGINTTLVDTVFLLLCALLIALTMKLVGVLLITALLIIPAVAAGRLAAGPESMALGAAIVGMLSVTGGLMASLHLDTPSGPSIVVSAFALFVLASMAASALQLWKGRSHEAG